MDLAGVSLRATTQTTETEVDPKGSLDELREKLRTMKITGKLVVDLMQGGTQRVTVAVKKKLR